MNHYDLITPEGTRDSLFDECTWRRGIESRLHRLFTERGYSEVITPTLEFYDVFQERARQFGQTGMYKLTDSKGRLLVLRPDNTVPIARVCATRLRDAKLPLRLCYNQNIHIISPTLKGRDDEIPQAGIELIGSDTRMADLEVIAAAADALRACGTDFTLELGSAAVFRALMARIDAPETTRRTIREYVEAKNYPELGDLLGALPDSEEVRLLRMLPRLFGGAEVFDRARAICRSEEFSAALSELQSLWNDVAAFAGKERVRVDLGMMHRADYYTGMILRGYLSGFGEEVLSGGRYDRLLSAFGYDVPATGFAVNVDAVVKVLRKRGKTPPEGSAPAPDVLIWAESGQERDALETAAKLRADGLRVEHALCGTWQQAREYAAERGITKVLRAREQSREPEGGR